MGTRATFTANTYSEVTYTVWCIPGRQILPNYTCMFCVQGVCREYTKNIQNTPCISGVFLEVAFQERVKLVYFTSDVYLVYFTWICGAEFQGYNRGMSKFRA